MNTLKMYISNVTGKLGVLTLDGIKILSKVMKTAGKGIGITLGRGIMKIAEEGIKLGIKSAENAGEETLKETIEVGKKVLNNFGYDVVKSTPQVQQTIQISTVPQQTIQTQNGPLEEKEIIRTDKKTYKRFSDKIEQTNEKVFTNKTVTENKKTLSTIDYLIEDVMTGTNLFEKYGDHLEGLSASLKIEIANFLNEWKYKKENRDNFKDIIFIAHIFKLSFKGKSNFSKLFEELTYEIMLLQGNIIKEIELSTLDICFNQKYLKREKKFVYVTKDNCFFEEEVEKLIHQNSNEIYERMFPNYIYTLYEEYIRRKLV